MARKRRRRSRVTFGTILKILLAGTAAAGAGFAAMHFYLRKPDEDTAVKYMQYIEAEDYASAYSLLKIEDTDPLMTLAHFEDYAAAYYREGTYELSRTSRSSDEAPQFEAFSEGSSDRQEVILNLAADDSGNWKILPDNMLGTLTVEIPAGYGLSVDQKVLQEVSGEASEITERVFFSTYNIQLTSEVFAAADQTVTVDENHSSAAAAIRSGDIAVSETADAELKAFAIDLAETYLQDIENKVSVDTVLDPDTYPVYTEEVSERIGNYLGDDFSAAIPWQIELEEGCRSTFYTAFASEQADANVSAGSFALNKTIVRKEETQAEMTGSECDADSDLRRFTYTVRMNADYSEDYYDAGDGTVKNSRTSLRTYSLKVTYSWHDDRWWVHSCSQPVRES